mmetsp:Transcript_14046/g.15698  ORF Transcript_14046/g.15698 Transcript_14046/m.15698 type:complete len:154 (+) Transcript_14046:131-592(+)
MVNKEFGNDRILYFSLANSLGKLLDISDNELYTEALLQLFDDFRAFCLFEQDKDPVLRYCVPSSSFSYGMCGKFDNIDSSIKSNHKYEIPEQQLYNKGKLSDFNEEKDERESDRENRVKVPDFNIFTFQNVPYEIDYFETCYSLLNILVYVYN